jgi:hypothetical protein
MLSSDAKLLVLATCIGSKELHYCASELLVVIEKGMFVTSVSLSFTFHRFYPREGYI